MASLYGCLRKPAMNKLPVSKRKLSDLLKHGANNSRSTVFINRHISRQNASWIGDWIVSDLPGGLIVKKKGFNASSGVRGLRSKATYSKDSRNRQRKQLMSIDFPSVAADSPGAVYGKCFFQTLTYPKQYPVDQDRLIADIDAFFKHCYRAVGKFGVSWKLEPQKRGAPHFHLILFMPKIMHVRKVKDLVDWWRKRTGSRWNKTTVLYVDKDNPYGPVNYIMKYQNKDIQHDVEFRRVWGFRNKNLIPFVKNEVVIPREKTKELLSVLKGARPENKYVQDMDGEYGVQLYGYNGEFTEALKRIITD